jgi:hypothetical protein
MCCILLCVIQNEYIYTRRHNNSCKNTKIGCLYYTFNMTYFDLYWVIIRCITSCLGAELFV